jgi:hypothetical protein
MLTTLPFLWLTACSTEQVEVYLFLLGQVEEISDNSSLSHNFTDAYEPDDDSDWSRAEDSKTSARAVFGELVTLVDGSALLQLTGQTFPGTGDKGSWNFNWEDFDRGVTTDTHTAGYTYIRDFNNSRLDEITLVEGSEAGTLSGTWKTTTVNALDQTEDDTWSQDVGMTTGQITVGGQIVVENDFGTEQSASNSGQDTDCDSSPCSLSTETTTVTERTLQAVLTDYGPDDLEQDLDDYGQREGF